MKHKISALLLIFAILSGSGVIATNGQQHLFIESNSTWAFDIYYKLKGRKQTVPFKRVGDMQDLGLLSEITELALGGTVATTLLDDTLRDIKKQAMSNAGKNAVLSIGSTSTGWTFKVSWMRAVQTVPEVGVGFVTNTLLKSILEGNMGLDLQKKASAICSATYKDSKNNLCSALEKECDDFIKQRVSGQKPGGVDQVTALRVLVEKYYTLLGEYRIKGLVQ